MTKTQEAKKLRVLHQLYQYRALGYTYAKNVPLDEEKESFFGTPSSLANMEKMVKKCHLCPLSKMRKHVLFGQGNPHAKVMFIAEAPSANEDLAGRFFVGRTGELLSKIITNVLRLKKEDVYITTLVKCRTKNNSVPSMDEIEACKSHLFEQIKFVNPKIIVTLGPTSYHYLTKEQDMKLSQANGEVFNFGNAKLIPTYHPSFLLRNPTAKRDVYQNMLRVKSML